MGDCDRMSENNAPDIPFHRLLRTIPADYWRLWYVGMIVSTVRWLETVVVGVVVYQQTGSAFIVAMITMLRLLPMGLFGAFLGAFAERFDRRLTLAGMVGLLTLTSALLSIIAWLGTLEVWHFAAASFINGCGWATDNPLRRTIMGEVMGRDRMATAMALDVGANNSSRMVGPTAGGLLLAGIGIEGAFVLSVVLYATAIAATLMVRIRMPATPGAGAVLARTWESIAMVLKDQRLSAILLVTIIYNVFAWPFTSMIPVIGRDQLRLGPEGVGLLTSVDGVGAFVGALVLALWLTPGWHARAYVGGVAVYLVSLIAFARARSCLGRHGVVDHRPQRCGLLHPAGHDRLSRRAGRDALTHHGCAVGVYRNRSDRLPLARLARRPDWRAAGDRNDRRDGSAGSRGDVAAVAADLSN